MGTVLNKLGKRSLKDPLWDGPEDDGPMGGVTQSLISRSLVCSERFRIHTMEGLKPTERWNHKFGYGNMWHECEEAYHANPTGRRSKLMTWQDKLRVHVAQEMEKHRHDQEIIEKWYQICKRQFPVYISYWKKQNGKSKVPKSLMQEVSFRVPYKLPSGRVVYLRGKWDNVYISLLERMSLVLQDHKTKGTVEEDKISSQLQCDLQIMTYLIALQTSQENKQYIFEDAKYRKYKIGSVNYNVVRRPLSGGKGTIRQHKAKGNKPAETLEHFYDRLLKDYIEKEPEDYFMRWDASVSEEDIELFAERTLDPALENMCDDFEWWNHCYRNESDPLASFDYSLRKEMFPNHVRRHVLLPFGIYNPVADAGKTDLDNYIMTGEITGLTRSDNLFPELAA